MSLKSLVIRPLIERAGTAVAAFLIGKSVADPALINELVAAAVAFVLVGVELVFAQIARRNEMRAERLRAAVNGGER